MASAKKKNNATFDVHLNLTVTGERFSVRSVAGETKIKELKIQVEVIAGIPYNLQRLHYLDKSDMVEQSDLRHNDIVPGATIDLALWKMWEHVVRVVVKGNVAETMRLGLTMDKEWEKLDRAFYKHKVETAKEKLHVSLLIAAHRNKTELVSVLLDLGADINYKSSMGRTALHLAASQGNSECIDMMLERGACIEATDVLGKSPVATAKAWGKKDSERHLFLYQWQTRASKTITNKKSPLKMHQKYDSSLPTWLRGDYGQIYYANILPPGEFSGSVISAPRRKPVRGEIGEVEELGPRALSGGHSHSQERTGLGSIGENDEEKEDGVQHNLTTKIVHVATEEQAKTVKRQTTITSNTSGNDGSRYCKGGFYLNPLLKSQTRAHSSRYDAISYPDPSIPAARLGSGYEIGKSIPSSAGSKISNKAWK